MTLQQYLNKRNFKVTPEPKGKVLSKKGSSLLYVVQKHRASHLHYDFRLEEHGVLLSWAMTYSARGNARYLSPRN